MQGLFFYLIHSSFQQMFIEQIICSVQVLCLIWVKVGEMENT